MVGGPSKVSRDAELGKYAEWWTERRKRGNPFSYFIPKAIDSGRNKPLYPGFCQRGEVQEDRISGSHIPEVEAQKNPCSAHLRAKDKG